MSIDPVFPPKKEAYYTVLDKIKNLRIKRIPQCHCYFQLNNYNPDGCFQITAVFL